MADVVKYGIQIPNRVFVGGVAFDTKEDELKEFFQQFGKIKECKIIKDNQSISRGFAFVTFECKHDANQAQQKRTVFFKQKKLNLGPAIRQKGVVFNGTKEAGNEPVLSTGVYIHPSGYSYTVAPNGVWYFHNADGTPPSSTPGAPPMAYAPNTMQKIQSHSPPATAKPEIQINSENNVHGRIESQPMMIPQTNIPVYHGVPVPPEMQTTQIIQADVPYANGSYIHTHSAIGTSNIHFAFQNMSISTHPSTVPVNHVTVPVHGNSMPPSSNDHLSTDCIPSPNPTFNTRINYPAKIYNPYYTNGKYPQHPQALITSDHQSQMNGHGPSHAAIQHFPLRHEYYPVMNSFYAFYGEPNHLSSQPTFVLPNSDMNGGESFDPSTNHFNKRNSQKNHYSKHHFSPRKEANFMKHSFANHVPIRNPVMQQ